MPLRDLRRPFAAEPGLAASGHAIGRRFRATRWERPGLVPPGAGDLGHASNCALLQKVDAVTIPVPSLEAGLRFYRDALGHQLRWRNEDAGQAGLALAGSDTEIVLTTSQGYEPDWLVASADEAAEAVRAAGGKTLVGPCDIPVGRLAVVCDPFGNTLVLLDLSKGHYVTDSEGNVTSVTR